MDQIELIAQEASVPLAHAERVVRYLEGRGLFSRQAAREQAEQAIDAVLQDLCG